MNDKIMAHCWLAYAIGLMAIGLMAIGLMACGHWIASIPAILMTALMVWDA
jgi:hypothetical protein